MRYALIICLFMLACGGPPPSKEPTTPMTRGQMIYMRQCVSCHQRDGSGKLRGHAFAADFTAADGVLVRSNEDLRESVLNGFEGKYGRMPAFKPILEPDEIEDVLSYIRVTFGSQEPASAEVTSGD